MAGEPYRTDSVDPSTHPETSVRLPQRRLSDNEVLDLIEEYEAGASQPELAAKYRVHRTPIMRAERSPS